MDTRERRAWLLLTATLAALVTLGTLAVGRASGSVGSDTSYAPGQPPPSPLLGQSWEELRLQHRARSEWWTRYYVAHPAPAALRELLDAYHDWIEALFDQEAIALASPYAAALEASRPTDVHGIWLVARYMHYAQRFADEREYLFGALDRHPAAYVLWMELGNSLAAQGLSAEPDAHDVAVMLRCRARMRAAPADAVRLETRGAAERSTATPASVLTRCAAAG